MTFKKAVADEELWEGEKLGVLIDGRPILLFRWKGVLRAYEDRCAHKGIPLSEGTLAGCRLTCRAHGWSYDISTGAGINPASARLKRCPVRVENGDILVDAEEDGTERDGALPETSREKVGPVLQAGPTAEAVVAAIRESNPDVEVLDRGAYLRVTARGRCAVRRTAVEKRLGRGFSLPGDLEKLMPSFQGKFSVSSEEAAWTAAGGA